MPEYSLGKALVWAAGLTALLVAGVLLADRFDKICDRKCRDVRVYDGQ